MKTLDQIEGTQHVLKLGKNMISGKYTAECNTSSEQFTTLRASINHDNACQSSSVILVKAKHQRKSKL